MPELLDLRSLSPESLELLRSLVVRAVIDLDLSQVDAATYYGVSPHTVSEVGDQGAVVSSEAPGEEPRTAERFLTCGA